MRYDYLLEALDDYREVSDRNLPSYDPVDYAKKSKEEAIKIAEKKLDDAFVRILVYLDRDVKDFVEAIEA